MLLGYFDDSGNVRQGKTCLIAGYVAPTEVWDDFSKRWEAALKEPPSIEYFKMSDAFARSKQFAGWTEVDRDAKVLRLVEVIMDTKLTYGAAVSIVNADYLREGKGMIDDAFINDVFYYLFNQCDGALPDPSKEQKYR